MIRDEKELNSRKSIDAEVQHFSDWHRELAQNAETSKMPIAFADFGMDAYLILFANASFLRLLGLRRNEVIGHDFSKLMSRHASGATLRNISTALSAGQRACFDAGYYTASAEEIYGSFFVSPIRNKLGQTETLFISILDTTDRYGEYRKACDLVNEFNQGIKNTFAAVLSFFSCKAKKGVAYGESRAPGAMRQRAALS